MPKRILLCLLAVIGALNFGHLTAILEPRSALAEDGRARDPAGVNDPDASPTRHPFSPRGAGSARLGTGSAGRSGSWWLGTAGIALALAVVGGLSIASRRFLPAAPAGALALRVVGRTSLSPRHAVYLLQAGDRVLVVGTGPQGPPALLGEWDEDPPLPERASPPPAARIDSARGGLA